MRVCVLQPDYAASVVDYRRYDPPRDLSPFLPGHTVDHVALDKRTTYAQLRNLATRGYDIFVNLCEGYLDWDVPSIDVIDALERLNLPYTGPTAALYDPSKPLMKYVAHTADVATPAHAVVATTADLASAVAGLRLPLFVKPAHAGDSLGIDETSLITDPAALEPRVASVVAEFGQALIEEYIAGRELTVLVVAGVDVDEEPVALTPVEFVFPPNRAFKTYALKTSELHPECNRPVRDPALAARLRDAAVRIFRAFGGVGYARLDFRLDRNDALFFLEINFTCSVFYRDSYQGSADYILANSAMGAEGFATRIIADGIARHGRKQRPFAIRGNSISGYGIVATRPIAAGEVVFRGEERATRIVTACHVATNWSAEAREVFRRYAYPLSDELYALWDVDPTAWAPQNHSCDANTTFAGLDVVAARDIPAGGELTLDYAEFMNEDSEPFVCRCGSASCRGTVTGTPGSSVTARETDRHSRV